MKNVLWLVESEPLGLQLHANVLSKSGYVVKSFPNPEGLNTALAEGTAPDLLIMGTMADGKSLSMLRQLRQQGLEFPIFMMSSSSDPIDLIMALEVGADDFLVKPVNPANCWRASRRACEGFIAPSKWWHLSGFALAPLCSI
jgi:DNA-binding response OmpR family regulator